MIYLFVKHHNLFLLNLFVKNIVFEFHIVNRRPMDHVSAVLFTGMTRHTFDHIPHIANSYTLNPVSYSLACGYDVATNNSACPLQFFCMREMVEWYSNVCCCWFFLKSVICVNNMALWHCENTELGPRIRKFTDLNVTT